MKQTRDNAPPQTTNAIHHHGIVPSDSELFRYEDYQHINIFLSYLKVNNFFISLNYLSEEPHPPGLPPDGLYLYFLLPLPGVAETQECNVMAQIITKMQ